MTAPTQAPFADVPPNAPGYREFRMMAEWASAIRDEPLCFPYDPAMGRVSVAQPISGQCAVFTTPDAVRNYRVRQVDFAVGGYPLVLDGDRCSALFWSESSVEKFLFPCLASASSDDAAGLLGRLSDAWYGYPGRVVQVCALAYHYSTRPVWGELSLEAAVGLVCLDRASGRLKLMGLSEFEQAYPTGAARGFVAAVDRTPAWEKLAPWKTSEIDSIVARECAEFISGIRGRYVYFTFDDGELTPWVYSSEDPGAPLPEGTLFAQGVTVAVRPDRPVPSCVDVWLEGHSTSNAIVSPGDDPTMAPDAMFWTDGAVEKLLLPYYASVKGRLAPFFNMWLMGQWGGLIPPGSTNPGDAVAALGKCLPAAPRPTGEDGRLQPGAEEDGGVSSDVYAITHLPRSEYVMDPATGGSGSPALEHRTGLLTFDGASFEVHPLFGGGA